MSTARPSGLASGTAADASVSERKFSQQVRRTSLEALTPNGGDRVQPSEAHWDAAMGNEKGSTEIKWLPEPEEHDYPAAESYLLLLHGETEVNKMISSLRSAKVTQFKAKDI